MRLMNRTRWAEDCEFQAYSFVWCCVIKHSILNDILEPSNKSTFPLLHGLKCKVTVTCCTMHFEPCKVCYCDLQRRCPAFPASLGSFDNQMVIQITILCFISPQCKRNSDPYMPILQTTEIFAAYCADRQSTQSPGETCCYLSLQ